MTSYDAMDYILAQVVPQLDSCTVLDIGSMVAEPGHKSYRDIAIRLGCRYVGMDLGPGGNVDVVATDPYTFPLDPSSFDVVVSGQVFEHIEFPWLTIREPAW